MENSKTVAAIRVSYIITKLTNLSVLRTDIFIKAWSNGRLLGIIPVRISIGASSVISTNDIVRVSDPNASWGLICVEQAP